MYEDAVMNDFSLSELAEEYGISRQGIHDLLKRCDATLEDYENKLGLIKRFADVKGVADEMKEIHVVALDFENTEYFVSILHQNRYDSKDYVNSIIQKLCDEGLEANFTYDDLRAELNQEFIGRMAIARKLVSLGLVGSIEEAFDEYIGDFGKRKAYVRPNVSKYILMDTAIIEIRKAGGIPLLCHPYSYNLSEEQVIRLIQDFKNCGGLAINGNAVFAIYFRTARETQNLR